MSIKLPATILATLLATNAAAQVNDEASLRAAIEAANLDSSIEKIIFDKNAYISLNAPVIYTGTQAIKLVGKGATIDGSSAGSFVLDSDLTAITEDGTLVFNTAADVTVRNLTIKNSATRGLVINIPEDADQQDIDVKLNNVSIQDSALFGLHIDDNADEFDDGVAGSAIGIDLKIINSNFTGNGTGAIDFDGVRVDERADGDINALIVNTHIDGNGGDGIELDEAGNGDVEATMINVTINDNGFYNEEDLDDGFDIDEADEGDIEVKLVRVSANNNMDEGLDFDEAGDGDVELKLRHVETLNNTDEGIKADEEDAGDIEAKLKHVQVIENGDDGIQFTELGEGKIEATLKQVEANDNAKYGVKAEQWVVEDEAAPIEPAGELKAKNVELSGNGNGDEIETNNVIVE